MSFFFFFNDTATTEIYTLSLHDALPICVTRTRILSSVFSADFKHRPPILKSVHLRPRRQRRREYHADRHSVKHFFADFKHRRPTLKSVHLPGTPFSRTRSRGTKLLPSQTTPKDPPEVIATGQAQTAFVGPIRSGCGSRKIQAVHLRLRILSAAQPPP